MKVPGDHGLAEFEGYRIVLVVQIVHLGSPLSAVRGISLDVKGATSDPRILF